jgi:hypothetical protein
MLATLEARRRDWEERRPRAYVIRVLKLSDCIAISTRLRAEGGPWRDRLVVRDTSIVGREPAPIPAAYAQRCGLAWRVDDLFADVARALADTTEYITGIEYDAAYGFPRAYWRDNGDPYSTAIQRPYAGSWGVLVESFAPAP